MHKIQNLSVKYMSFAQGSGCCLRRLSWLHVGILAKIVKKLLQLFVFVISVMVLLPFGDYLVCTDCKMLTRIFNVVLDLNCL